MNAVKLIFWMWVLGWAAAAVDTYFNPQSKLIPVMIFFTPVALLGAGIAAPEKYE